LQWHKPLSGRSEKGRMRKEEGVEAKKGEGKESQEGITRGQHIVKLDGWGYADSGTLKSKYI